MALAAEAISPIRPRRTRRAGRPSAAGRTRPPRRGAGAVHRRVAILMGSITGEALHPGPYTTHADTLSHLGASEPPNSVVVQPTAWIFDGTMLGSGALILMAAWCLHRALHRKPVTVPTALLGLGVLGVGLFP